MVCCAAHVGAVLTCTYTHTHTHSVPRESMSLAWLVVEAVSVLPGARLSFTCLRCPQPNAARAFVLEDCK